MAGYIEVNLRYGGKQYRTMGHRIAWFLYYGYWPEHYLDHINGDKKDNRITNLREATHTQNMANRGKVKTTPQRIVKTNSPPHISHETYVGVHLLPSGNWCAKHKGHLGTFPTAEEAALCYNEAVKRSYGEYAQLNDVDLPNESCHTIYNRNKGD